jgi:hypothetical protein
MLRLIPLNQLMRIWNFFIEFEVFYRLFVLNNNLIILYSQKSELISLDFFEDRAVFFKMSRQWKNERNLNSNDARFKLNSSRRFDQNNNVTFNKKRNFSKYSDEIKVEFFNRMLDIQRMLIEKKRPVIKPGNVIYFKVIKGMIFFICNSEYDYKFLKNDNLPQKFVTISNVICMPMSHLDFNDSDYCFIYEIFEQFIENEEAV